ncbi:hypothetical protein [Paracidovorax sp. MALMAid1276]|uniref:hypothetical protein n=1 Tax=Paracidovorax sp. MALMAid1276 TaxID=3411631 RepID=UPI003B9C0333
MIAFRLLLVAVLALSGALASRWVTADGQLRQQLWSAPEAIPPDLSAPKVPSGIDARGSGGATAYFAILDRPMFAPDRRPPPPPDAKPEEPPPDPLAGLTLYGIFTGADFSGIVARINDKVRRVRVGEPLGEWTVKSVQGREVVFARGDETRAVTLAHAFGPRPALPPSAGQGAPGAAPAPGVRPDLASIQQQEQEAARERLRQRNELFRKAGLPPVKE